MKQVSNKDYGLIVRYLYDYMVLASLNLKAKSTRERNRVRICGKLFKKLTKRL